MDRQKAMEKKKELERLEAVIRGLKEREHSLELSFIQSRGLSVGELADIGDEGEFAALLDEWLAEMPELEALVGRIAAAETEKRKIEEELIEMTIALAPPEAAEQLRKGSRLVVFRRDIIEIGLSCLG